jgi:hypothetical protein
MLDDVFDFTRRKNWKAASVFYAVVMFMCGVGIMMSIAVHAVLDTTPLPPSALAQLPANVNEKQFREFEIAYNLGRGDHSRFIRIVRTVFGLSFGPCLLGIVLYTRRIGSMVSVAGMLATTLLGIFIGPWASAVPVAYLTTVEGASDSSVVHGPDRSEEGF